MIKHTVISRPAAWLACSVCAACAVADEANSNRLTKTEASNTLATTALEASALVQPLLRMPWPILDGSNLLSLVETSSGYAAFYRTQHSSGGGKSNDTCSYKVYTSEDGLRWAPHDLPETYSSTLFRSLAYGKGRFLVAGDSRMQGAALTTSLDAATTWQDVGTDLPAVYTLAFVNDRFFALSLQHGIFTSSDGSAFTGGPTETLQFNDIAYGSNTYIAVGSGPIMVSHDAATWSPVSLDCALPEACISVPGESASPGDCSASGCTDSGRNAQGFRSRALFGNGHFVTDSFISEDAEHWRAITDPERVPDAFAAGYFFKLASNRLSAWHEDEPVLTTEVVDDNPDQLDCRGHRCLLFPDALILVP